MNYFHSLPESAGPDRYSSGGWESDPARQRSAGESSGGADLPASLEKPQRLCPADRLGPACFPATGGLHLHS